MSLASLRGKVVLLTFLDPACTTGCAVAQEFRATGQLLGASSRDVALVAITLSPSYRSAAVISAFNRRERLDTVPGWLFLTGSLPQLQRVWQAYSVPAYGLSAGPATAHTGQAYVIDRAGRVRQVLNTGPGPGTAATEASFASLLAGAARKRCAHDPGGQAPWAVSACRRVPSAKATAPDATTARAIRPHA